MVSLLATGWVASGKLVSGVPALAVATGRSAASFIAITAVAALHPRSLAAVRASSRRHHAIALLAFLGFFLYYSGTLLAVEHIGASRVGLVVSLLPCITFGIGAVAFGENATLRKVGGTIAAVGAAVGYSLVGNAADAAPHLGTLATGGSLALAGTFSYALYGYVYRRYMSDVPPIAALPAITGAGTIMLAVASVWMVSWRDIALSQWGAIAALGAGLTAPVFLISHELILRRGPLFTSALALAVPFLIRLGEWAGGEADAPTPLALLFLIVCAAGVWMSVTVKPSRRVVPDGTSE